MSTDPDLNYAAPTSKKSRWPFWLGWVISGLISLSFLMGGVMDLLKPPFVVEGLTKAGFREEVIVPIGVVTILSTLLYLIPRTALFGAILLTAYLGGAVCIHVRAAEYGQMLVPIVFAVVLWVGLVLRDARVRAAAFGVSTTVA